MRKLLIILSIAFVFVSCSKEQITHQTNNGVIHIEYEEDQEPEFPTPPTPTTQQNYPDWMLEKYDKVTHYEDSIYKYHPNNTIFDTILSFSYFYHCNIGCNFKISIDENDTLYIRWIYSNGWHSEMPNGAIYFKYNDINNAITDINHIMYDTISIFGFLTNTVDKYHLIIDNRDICTAYPNAKVKMIYFGCVSDWRRRFIDIEAIKEILNCLESLKNK